MSAADLDLTPRDITPKTGSRKWLPIALVVLIAVAIIAVLLQTLGGASLFIYTADKAVEERSDLGDARFRLQGSPIGNTVEDCVCPGVVAASAVAFTINFEGQLVDVVHSGSPAELFQPGVPVVLEGHWVEGEAGWDEAANDGYYFASDNMIVSHDNDYRLENQERLDDAKEGGSVSVAS